MEVVGEVNLTKTLDNHNFTVGAFLSNTKALDNNWIHNVLGDFSNSPRAVRLTGNLYCQEGYSCAHYLVFKK